MCQSYISCVRIGETPTHERQRHNGGTRPEIIDRDVTGRILLQRHKAVWDCPLDVYLSREAIGPFEYEAAFKFRNAYFRAVLGMKVANIGAGSAGDREMAMLTPIYSARLLNEAYGALSAKQKDIVVNVCGHDEVAGDSARLKTLRRGLERLCEIWKLNELGAEYYEE